mgnify:CR=1 FL=1
MNINTMSIINNKCNNNKNQKQKVSLFPDNNPAGNVVSKKEYSYKCLNVPQLSTEIYEGTSEAVIEIILKNNGKEVWPMNNAKLITNKSSSTLALDDIVLEPQRPGEQKIYYAIFKGLSGASAGDYKSYLSFYASNEFYGEKLEMTVKIKKKTKEMIEIEKVKKMREQFNIFEQAFSNEVLLKALKRYKDNYDEAFGSLFIESK